MKKDNQYQIQRNEAGKLNARLSFLSKTTRKYYINIVAAIFAVIVLHMGMQFIFFKSENPESKNSESEISSVKIENRQVVEIKTQNEAKKPEVVERIEKVEKPVFVPPTVKSKSAVAPSRNVLKKPEPRESRDERLRRAEKILTGV